MTFSRVQVDPYELPESRRFLFEEDEFTTDGAVALHITDVAIEVTVDVLGEGGVVGHAAGIIIETSFK